MHPILHHFLLLSALPAVFCAFGFEEATRIAHCLIRCSNFHVASTHIVCDSHSCQITIDFLPSVFRKHVLSPAANRSNLFVVSEPAMANTSLHCRSTDLLIIKFNPGIYVVEQSSFDENLWDSARVSSGKLMTFRNLTAGTRYRYRVHRLLKDGFSLPEVSDWFDTYPVDYQPMEVKEISQPEIILDEMHSGKLDAEVEFVPAEDRNCDYEVIFWSGQHRLMYSFFQSHKDFRIKLYDVHYNVTNVVHISSKNDVHLSNQTSLGFFVPSCLEIFKNVNICAPASVENLQAKHQYRQGLFYDVLITWDKPVYEPDNYTIQLDLLNELKQYVEESVAGNETQFTFFNLELGLEYVVSILAESPGGRSRISQIAMSLNDVNRVIQGYNLSHVLMIVLPALVTIVILVTGLVYQWHRHKNKHFITERSHFKILDEKDPHLKKVKKQLSHSYALEGCITPLMGDKYELSSDLLELKGVLGSGAYGIVRFGSLKDEFDNAKDVAVKMLRDNPSTEDVRSFHQEIMMMKTAGQHPNIVSLFGCCTLYNQPVLVVEYCCKGDLQTYLRTIWQSTVNVALEQRARLKLDSYPISNSDGKHHLNNSGGNEPHYQNIRTIANRLYDIQEDVAKSTDILTGADLLNFSRQVATGMEYLASNRIVHRDLAARNVLVCSDKVVKISDFGLSRDIYQENLYRKQGSGKLPVKWMAIEALTHQVYTTHSDMWSFGILLWEIVTMGAVPYPGIPTDKVLKLLKSGYRMERPPNCGVELYNIMYSCWHARPQSRPSFTKVKEKLDKWLANYSENDYLIMCEVLNESPDSEQKE